MVGKEAISNTLDKSINKHLQLKHGIYFQHIRECLREVTDSKEEYETLRDDIWDFMEKTKNSDHEELIMRGDDGTFFENKDGNEHNVQFTESMLKFKDDNLVFHTIHNHPFTSCFQSLKDFNASTVICEKYGVTIGKDGLMIFVNRNREKSSGYRFELLDAYKVVHEEMETNAKEKYKTEFDDLKEKYDYVNASIGELEEYKEKCKEITHKYLSNKETIEKWSNRLNTQFQERYYGHLNGTEVFYVKK